MSQESNAPPVPKVLLEWLDKMFPEKCADPDDTDRQIWIKVGKRHLIERLRHEYNKQFKEKED